MEMFCDVSTYLANFLKENKMSLIVLCASSCYETFFYSVLRPFQDYFTHIETSQLVGGAKRGVPQKKPT